MLRVDLIAVALLAAFVAGLAPAAASAAPAEWMLNGKTLAEEGLTTAALATTGKIDENGVIVGPGLTITCTGGEALTSPEVIKSTKGKAKNLIATACSASPTSCKVPTTIGVVPVEIEVTLDGVLAVKGVIRPQSGTIFTTLAITGEGCAAEGNKVITGDLEVLAPEGQDERTDQLFETNQGPTGLLKVGSSASSVKGSVLLLLANRAAWSFL